MSGFGERFWWTTWWAVLDCRGAVLVSGSDERFWRAVLVDDLVGGFEGDCRGAVLVSGSDERFWRATFVGDLVGGGFGEWFW